MNSEMKDVIQVHSCISNRPLQQYKFDHYVLKCVILFFSCNSDKMWSVLCVSWLPLETEVTDI